MGGAHSPFTNFLISDFVLKDTKKIFCKCYQNYLRHLWLKFFILQINESWFPWHPKGSTPTINLEVFFQTYWPRQVSYTLCMDLKLDMYNHLDKLKSFKKF